MLQSIRDKAHGWIAWTIVILISIPFALWGINEYFGVGSDPAVAQVNGVEITQSELDTGIQRYRMNLRDRLGSNYRPDSFPDELIRRQVLESRIRDILMVQSAHDMRLRAGDEMVRASIRAVPAFQRGGRFDNQAYQAALRSQGMSAGAFERRMRDDLAVALLELGVAGGALVTDRELDDYLRLRDQTRDIGYARLEAAVFSDSITPSDVQVEEYYEANGVRFMQPERVVVEYLDLNRDTLAETVSVDEADLVAFFEDTKTAYSPPEKRTMRHILVASETEAAELAKRIDAGEDFAELAREYSQDPGSAASGGDLGVVERGIMVPAFEAAALALAEGEISVPVGTEFGFHIIQVTAIEGGGSPGLDEIRDEVVRAYREDQAERMFFDQAERLGDLVYESPDSLNPAAEVLGLEVQRSDWITRAGGEGDLASPRVVTAAFSDDVLQQGNNSDPLELDNSRILVLRVVDHHEAQPKLLEDVREEIIGLLRTQAASEQAAGVAESMRDAVAQGRTLDSVAQENGLEPRVHAGVARTATDLESAIVNAAFEAGRPQAGTPVVTLVPLPGGDHAVLKINAVHDADPGAISAEEREAARESLENRRRSAAVDLFLAQQRTDADISIVPPREE
ncbi:MAG: SurA N-terminal domain-containing protein [Pseudomonadota bacterium]